MTNKNIREAFRDKVNKIDNIKKFIRLNKIDDGVYRVIDSVFDAFIGMIGDDRDFVQLINVSRRELEKEMPRLVDLLVPVFDEYFGDKEIEDIVAFYETGAGKKMLGFREDLTEECEKMGHEWLAPALARVHKWIEDNMP